jgi:hypothetical protein
VQQIPRIAHGPLVLYHLLYASIAPGFDRAKNGKSDRGLSPVMEQHADRIATLRDRLLERGSKYDYSSRGAGSHVALFDGNFTRCSISPRSSSRNRAQSARRSSDTNSPGGSDCRSRGDPASGAGPDTESPPRCGNCGKSWFCNRRCRARTSKSRRQVDSTVRGPPWDHPNR